MNANEAHVIQGADVIWHIGNMSAVQLSTYSACPTGRPGHALRRSCPFSSRECAGPPLPRLPFCVEGAGYLIPCPFSPTNQLRTAPGDPSLHNLLLACDGVLCLGPDDDMSAPGQSVQCPMHRFLFPGLIPKFPSVPGSRRINGVANAPAQIPVPYSP